MGVPAMAPMVGTQMPGHQPAPNFGFGFKQVGNYGMPGGFYQGNNGGGGWLLTTRGGFNT